MKNTPRRLVLINNIACKATVYEEKRALETYTFDKGHKLTELEIETVRTMTYKEKA